MNIFEIDAIDLLGIACFSIGISWLLSLLLCYLRGYFEYDLKYKHAKRLIDLHWFGTMAIDNSKSFG